MDETKLVERGGVGWLKGQGVVGDFDSSGRGSRGAVQKHDDGEVRAEGGCSGAGELNVIKEGGGTQPLHIYSRYGKYRGWVEGYAGPWDASRGGKTREVRLCCFHDIFLRFDPPRRRRPSADCRSFHACCCPSKNAQNSVFKFHLLSSQTIPAERVSFLFT